MFSTSKRLHFPKFQVTWTSLLVACAVAKPKRKDELLGQRVDLGGLRTKKDEGIYYMRIPRDTLEHLLNEIIQNSLDLF